MVAETLFIMSLFLSKKEEKGKRRANHPLQENFVGVVHDTFTLSNTG
jgi:hypothetical protein